MNKFLIGVAALATAAIVSQAGVAAAASGLCEDRATPTIVAPGEGDKCQKAITKATGKYLKTLLTTRGKCIAKGDYTACPNTKDDTKVQTAAVKAQDAIIKACGDSSSLGSSYVGADAGDIGSCTLSQHHGTAEIYLGETHGAPGGADSAADRIKCQATISKEAQKFLPAVLKSVNKCIDLRIKKGLTVDPLGPACVGSLSSSGTYTPPTDTKTADAIAKAISKSEGKIAKLCGSLTATKTAALFGCPGVSDPADLGDCVRCTGLNAMFEIVDQQYAETGSLIDGTSIQDAVDAGSPGDKFLITSGNYSEGVVLPGGTCGDAASNSGASCDADDDCIGDTCDSDADGMQFVGCGAATDDRPVILPPAMSPPLRGILAAGVDGLHFQALDVQGWQNDGIFVTGAQGVSFRDCKGDGSDLSTPEEGDSVSVYAFFPVESDDVVVEGCEVTTVRDAGIYVGSSTNIVVRHNIVHDNVTGIEIENSEFATVYGNLAYANTGGLLNFKLPGPAKQTSGFHHFFENISFSNNTPNFAIPGTTVSAVVRGTGFMILSEDDTLYERNVMRDNDTFGFLILDQEVVNALVDPSTFDPTSPDQDTERLTFLNNSSLSNGGDPDPASPLSGNWVYALSTDDEAGTCFTPTPGGATAASVFVEFLPCM